LGNIWVGNVSGSFYCLSVDALLFIGLEKDYAGTNCKLI